MKTEWSRADDDHSGTLEFTEIAKLCEAMNMKVKKAVLMEQFRKVDVDNNGTLDFEEFVQFVRNLRRQEHLDALFKKYAAGKAYMTVADVLAFLRECQHVRSFLPQRRSLCPLCFW